MPLRDHFHGPVAAKTWWDWIHGGWPMALAQRLRETLPPNYVAAPLAHLGSAVEVDVAALEDHSGNGYAADAAGGGVATAVWAPGRPTRIVEVEPPDVDEYEVRVYDAERGQSLVAAVEFVSPSNKDRPDARLAFAAKCAALLRQGVTVAVVDIVTERTANLYRELLDLLRQPEPVPLADEPIYAVVCRYRLQGARRRGFEAWEEPLAVGRPLPTLPLWLTDELAVPLELEASYEETCRVLRVA